MSRIVWKNTPISSGDWWRGYVGETVFFAITAWDKDGRPGWELVCTLPEHRAEDTWPYDSVDDAKGWSEEILKTFLKKTGLQFKPAPKPRAKKVTK